MLRILVFTFLQKVHYVAFLKLFTRSLCSHFVNTEFSHAPHSLTVEVTFYFLKRSDNIIMNGFIPLPKSPCLCFVFTIVLRNRGCQVFSLRVPTLQKTCQPALRYFIVMAHLNLFNITKATKLCRHSTLFRLGRAIISFSSTTSRFFLIHPQKLISDPKKKLHVFRSGISVFACSPIVLQTNTNNHHPFYV